MPPYLFLFSVVAVRFPLTPHPKKLSLLQLEMEEHILNCFECFLTQGFDPYFCGCLENTVERGRIY